jgi:hypothetical protein
VVVGRIGAENIHGAVHLVAYVREPAGGAYVHRGRTDLLPEAGLAVYVRGPGGKLASARIYDDCDPPL